MKTPMQELIDSVGYMAQGLDADELYDYFMKKAKAMLEKEKEVMCGIYDDALARVDRNYIGGEGEQYYNETFNTKEK